MKYTMAVFSLKGTVPHHRYDFMVTAKPGGVGYYRYQAPELHSRWMRIGNNLSVYPLDWDSDLIAGPALMEVTDIEAQEIEKGGVLHPPRNVGLRAERIRKNWEGAHTPANRMAGWIEEWRNATRNNDHLWIGARTHKNGRVRDSGPFIPASAVITATATETGPSTSTESPTSATSPQNNPSVNAAPINSYVYPELVKGQIRRSNGEYYRVRKIGRKQDVMVFREMREKRIHMLTFGQPGTGKTAAFEAAFGDNMITMMGTEDTESADFQGSYVESDAGIWMWEDGPLVIAMERGWVLYIDEIGVIRQKQMSQLYSVMDGRNEIRITANPKRGIVRAAPGFAIAASTNPDSPEVRLTDALLNRMGLKLQVNSDFKMASTEFGIPEWLTGAAENLEVRRVAKEVPWAPQTRDLLLWKDNVEILGGELEALGVMVNSAPAPSRPIVADVLSKAIGKKVRPLVMA